VFVHLGLTVHFHTKSFRFIQLLDDGECLLILDDAHKLSLHFNRVRVLGLHDLYLGYESSRQLDRSPLKGHTNTVQSVAFSLDGKKVVLGSSDCTICIWDAANAQLVGSPIKGHTSSVLSFAFSPDGKQIVSGSHDCTVRIWDAGSGQLVGSPLEGHTCSVTSVAFSPDSKQIVSGSSDCTVCVLDAASGQLIGSPLIGSTLKSSWDPVKSVAFSPDGQQIVSYSYRKWPCVWDAASGQLVESDDTPQHSMNFLLASNKGGFVTQLTDLPCAGSPWAPLRSVWLHSSTKVVMGVGDHH
jgi:WD40 repeat protein